MSILYLLFGKIITIDDFIREMKRRKEKQAKIIVQTTEDLTAENPFYKQEVFACNHDFKVNLKINSFSCATMQEDEAERELGIAQTEHRALQEALVHGRVLDKLHGISVTINGREMDQVQIQANNLEKEIIIAEGKKMNTSK